MACIPNMISASCWRAGYAAGTRSAIMRARTWFFSTPGCAMFSAAKRPCARTNPRGSSCYLRSGISGSLEEARAQQGGRVSWIHGLDRTRTGEFIPSTCYRSHDHDRRVFQVAEACRHAGDGRGLRGLWQWGGREVSARRHLPGGRHCRRWRSAPQSGSFLTAAHR